jgi:SHS2 domain-containing protein
VKSVSASDLIVDWLSELILCAATHGERYGAVTIDRVNQTEVEATLHGAPVDAQAHELRFDVKAATYHGLELREAPGRLEARVIFDL